MKGRGRGINSSSPSIDEDNQDEEHNVRSRWQKQLPGGEERGLGWLAQLVERLAYNELVSGSSPLLPNSCCLKASSTFFKSRESAGVVELVDIPDLGSGASKLAGSSPATRIETRSSSPAEICLILLLTGLRSQRAGDNQTLLFWQNQKREIKLYSSSLKSIFLEKDFMKIERVEFLNPRRVKDLFRVFYSCLGDCSKGVFSSSLREQKQHCLADIT